MTPRLATPILKTGFPFICFKPHLRRAVNVESERGKALERQIEVSPFLVTEEAPLYASKECSTSWWTNCILL